MSVTEKVSVIIPVYNDAKYIGEAIESAINQTYSEIEIIVINDGSSDSGETERAVSPYLDKIIYRYKENKGVSSARNFGIDVASGHYIVFLDSDDLFLPNKIEHQVKYMKDRNIQFSYTDYEKIDRNGKRIEIVQVPEESNNFPGILASCGIATPTVMVNHELFLDKRFDEKLDIAEDVCMWIDFSYQYRLCCLQEALTKVRIKENTAAYDPIKHRKGLANIILHILDNDKYCGNKLYVYLLVKSFYELYKKEQHRDSNSLFIEEIETAINCCDIKGVKKVLAKFLLNLLK